MKRKKEENRNKRQITDVKNGTISRKMKMHRYWRYHTHAQNTESMKIFWYESYRLNIATTTNGLGFDVHFVICSYILRMAFVYIVFAHCALIHCKANWRIVCLSSLFVIRNDSSLLPSSQPERLPFDLISSIKDCWSMEACTFPASCSLIQNHKKQQQQPPQQQRKARTLHRLNSYQNERSM